jgi:alpha-glucosidase (family GH31 glycosyl hydrolase)
MASIITGTLALGLVGYPFVLPDTIGGNWFVGPEADRELFIRWTQANAALLTMQFSYAPWDYDEETAQICQRFAVLHQTLAPLRIAAAEQAVRTGQPPIRPIFWQDPSDPIAQVITDAFMLGDTLLVAPVVQRGAVSRDIYLPRGRWRDYWSDAHYEGGRWLMQFPAPLPVLPLFVRVGS